MLRTTALMIACRLLCMSLLTSIPLLASAQAQEVDKETTLSPAAKPAPVVKTKTTVAQPPAAAPLPNVLGPSAPVSISDGRPVSGNPQQGATFSTARRAPTGQQDPEDVQPAPAETNP